MMHDAARRSDNQRLRADQHCGRSRKSVVTKGDRHFTSNTDNHSLGLLQNRSSSLSICLNLICPMTSVGLEPPVATRKRTHASITNLRLQKRRRSSVASWSGTRDTNKGKREPERDQQLLIDLCRTFLNLGISHLAQGGS